MKVVRINQLEETEREVKFTGGISYRAIVKSDSMGFAMMKTVIPKGGPHHWHYKHHKEACYCIKGKGIVTDLKTGIGTMITPDVIYLIDEYDDHTFEALQDTILISVFNPPLTGSESHDENGVYGADPFHNKAIAKNIVSNLAGCKNDYDAIEIVQKILNEN